MMANTVLVPPKEAPISHPGLSHDIQSNLSLPTAQPAWEDLRLHIFLVKPIRARLWAPHSQTKRCT